MQTQLSKNFFYAVALSVLFLLFASVSLAQENTSDKCMNDPFPSEAPSREVPCDDPSCNVGPCATPQETQSSDETCWSDPTKLDPGGYGQVEEVRCDDPKCTDGPCNNTPRPEREVKQIEERTETQVERRATLQQIIQDRIINLTSNIVARLESASDRLNDIIRRIDSRILKLTERGVDTSSANAKLDEAKNSLSRAMNALDNMPSVREALGSDSPREAFGVIREELKNIRDLLKQTHSQLREVVALLKEALQNIEVPSDSE